LFRYIHDWLLLAVMLSIELCRACYTKPSQAKCHD